MPLKLVVALALAMLLDKGIRGVGLYRALFYLPSLLGASVAVAVLWRQLFERDGIVNQLLAVRRLSRARPGCTIPTTRCGR